MLIILYLILWCVALGLIVVGGWYWFQSSWNRLIEHVANELKQALGRGFEGNVLRCLQVQLWQKVLNLQSGAYQRRISVQVIVNALLISGLSKTIATLASMPTTFNPTSLTSQCEKQMDGIRYDCSDLVDKHILPWVTDVFCVSTTFGLLAFAIVFFSYNIFYYKSRIELIEFEAYRFLTSSNTSSQSSSPTAGEG